MDDKTLIALVEKFGNSDLAELELQDGSTRLKLRKAAAFLGVPGGPIVAGASPAEDGGTSGGGHAVVHLGLPAKADQVASAGGPEVPGAEAVTAPIVATFYRSASPDSPPFAEAGQRIKAGDTLCILEAMKMMNHLEAEFDCEILAVKAENGDLVEYGQTLFEVRRI